LVDVARLEDGTLEVRASEINLRQLLQPLVDQRRLLARQRKVALGLVASPEITITADADLVTRTVENILDNALRHAPPGGMIEIALRESGAEVELRIGNSGPAIPIEARTTIFEKYGQADVDVGRRNLGLGLHFARLAIEAHGGRIWVEETEKLPTVFGIRLPRLPEPALRPGQSVPGTADGPSGPGKVDL
jgi:signal transduction histidine kinase